jgi:hypothetical protein
VIDINKRLRRIENKQRTMVQRALVNKPAGADAQTKTVGGRLSDNVEHFQGQGVHFQAPKGAEGVCFNVCGEADSAVLLAAGDRRALPSDPLSPLAPGEGGLHYMGAFKVFLSFDGKLSLGEKMPDDFVALASKVDEELAKTYADFLIFKAAVESAISSIGVDSGAAQAAYELVYTAAIPPVVAANVPHVPDPVGSTEVRCV